MGLTELTVRMARYFDAEDDWLIEYKHPVDAFITRINTYDQPEPSARPSTRIRNCPQCHHGERGHDNTCDHCDWTREAWEAWAPDGAS